MGRAKTSWRELVDQAETVTQPASWDLRQENPGSSGLPGLCEPQGFLTSPAQLVIPGEKEGALGYRALKGRLGLSIET